MDTKICTKCKEEFPATTEYFYRKSRGKFGVDSVCRNCRCPIKTDVKIPKEGHKFCTKCNKELPITNEFFYFNNKKKTRFASQCKECTREYDNSYKRQQAKREWTHRNREKVRKVSREYKATPSAKAKTRLNHVLHNYQLTEDELVQMMNNQKGCCEVCGDSLVKPDSKRFYAVDHNHTTCAIRGLLCNECNLVLGYVKEDKDTLLKAIAYLEKYNE